MGQIESSQVEIENKSLQQTLVKMQVKNTNNYRFVNKMEQSIVLQNIMSKQYYVLRSVIMTCQQDSLSLVKLLQNRKKLCCIHLCSIVSILSQQQSQSCTKIYTISILIQCPILSLKQQLITRKSTNNFFPQPQLWAIVYSLVKALKCLYLYGIQHQALGLDMLMIDVKGVVKLRDPLTFGSQKNFVIAMKQKDKTKVILSPQILLFLHQDAFYFYQKEKSDIFVLGIHLLQLSSLKQTVIYDYKLKKSKFEQIQLHIDYIKNNYSDKYVNLIKWMTHIQPKKRPRLNQLLDFVDKNNSEGSTSMTNTVHQSPNSIPTIQKNQKSKKWQNAPSAFSIQSKHHSEYLTPIVSLTKIDFSATNIQNADRRTDKKLQLYDKDIFPFQLVYNRIINNNQNMKKFQVQKLYGQFKNQGMFRQSCRGSVPSSSIHSKLDNSKHFTNKNIKFYDTLKYQKQKDQYQKQQNLNYSHSSGLQTSNKLTYSKNSLTDIKLVQSNHFKLQTRHTNNLFINTNKKMSEIEEVSSISSPYRKIADFKSVQIKSRNSNKYLDIEPIVFKDIQYQKSKIFPKYNSILEYQNQNTLEHPNLNTLECPSLNALQHRQININHQFYSQQKQKYTELHYEDMSKSQSRHQTNKIVGYPNHIMHDELMIQKQYRYKDERILKKVLKEQQQQQKYELLTANFVSGNKQPLNFSQQAELHFKQVYSSSSPQQQSGLQCSQQLILVQNETYDNLDKYTGYKTKLGQKQRHGRLQFHDGGYYQGQWKNDKMQGYGEMYYTEGKIAYKGLWKDGSFHGTGKIFNDTPSTFQGTFNYRDFTQIQDHWQSYQGEVQDDSKHGKGRINLTNGEYFIGMFDYDMIEGNGVFHTLSGRQVKGIWKDNQLIQQI